MAVVGVVVVVGWRSLHGEYSWGFVVNMCCVVLVVVVMEVAVVVVVVVSAGRSQWNLEIMHKIS